MISNLKYSAEIITSIRYLNVLFRLIRHWLYITYQCFHTGVPGYGTQRFSPVASIRDPGRTLPILAFLELTPFKAYILGRSLEQRFGYDRGKHFALRFKSLQLSMVRIYDE
jgi:hypothetical protein